MSNDIKKELDNLSPLLSKMKEKGSRQGGFSVPEDYFTKMEAAIWQEVKPEPVVITEPVVQEPSLWEKFLEQVNWLLQPQPAMAFASVVLLIGGGFFLFSNAGSTDLDTDLAAVESLDLDIANEYLAANLDDFDTETLIDWAVEEEVAEASLFDESDVDKLLNEMKNENIDLNTLEQLL